MSGINKYLHRHHLCAHCNHDAFTNIFHVKEMLKDCQLRNINDNNCKNIIIFLHM